MQLPWVRRSTRSGWVAVAPRGALAFLARVRTHPGERPSLRAVGSIDWQDPTQALRRLRREHRIDQYRCVGLLERHQYQLLALDAPEVEREHWRDALRWQLREQVEFPVEDAAIDLLEIPAELSQRGRASVLAVAAAHTEVAPLAHAADDANTPWAALDVPETALRNIAALHEDNDQAVALLHVGERECALVITARGELLQSRVIDHIAHHHLTDAGESYHRVAFERIGLELQRSFDNFERLFGRVRIARLVVAGATLDLFLDNLRNQLDQPVVPLQLQAVMDLDATPELTEPAAQAQYLHAIGAALRSD